MPAGKREGQLNLMKKLLLIFLLALISGACEKDSDQPVKAARLPDAVRGKRVYMGTCIQCHNSDPSKDGPVAPAVKGASEALIEARILHRAYPPGYTPKRKTTTMPAFPYLKSAIADLAAFLS